MRVKMKTTMAGPDGVVHPGQVIDVAAEKARALVEGRFASEVDRLADQAPAAVDPGKRRRGEE